MPIEKRGVQNIKTMGGVVDGRRIRSSSGALLELSMLAMEKQRLKNEMLRSEMRCAEIRGRMGDIELKQVRLQQFLDRPCSDPQAGIRQAAATPLPIHSEPTERLKRRQLAY